MNYDLAKKLKDAGFPHEWPILWKEKENWPTLSELIEACGYQFHLLEKEPNTPDYWRCLTIVLDKRIEVKGSTPEEATANLWLALNPRNDNS